MKKSIKLKWIILSGLIVLNACSIEKRKYMSGYYIDKHNSVSKTKFRQTFPADEIVSVKEKLADNYCINNEENAEENLKASLEKNTNSSGSKFSVHKIVSEKKYVQKNTLQKTDKKTLLHTSMVNASVQDIAIEKTNKNEMSKKAYESVKKKYSGSPHPVINIIELILGTIFFIGSLAHSIISWSQDGFNWHGFWMLVIIGGLFILLLFALSYGK